MPIDYGRVIYKQKGREMNETEQAHVRDREFRPQEIEEAFKRFDLKRCEVWKGFPQWQEQGSESTDLIYVTRLSNTTELLPER